MSPHGARSGSAGVRAERNAGRDVLPHRPAAGRSGGIPLPLTRFVGRGREIGAVTELLGRSRLLTLAGPGGSGKTRLAIEVARRVASSFEDGAAWVDLAPVADPGLVPQTVATALGVRQQPGHSFTHTLAGRLGPSRLLLVLDNCEHLVGACAELADALLRACPRLHVLATSRESLGVEGEVASLVPPLSLPAAEAGVEAMREAEAVQLFVERAAAALPAFRLTASNAPAVARICRTLDGIPLAIELAAARARVLAPKEIAARLDDCFALLTTGSRTAVPRQQTLRATIDWSHDLLAEPERILFRRLSAFTGGFTLGAAEAVCAGEAVEPHDVLDLLTHLIDRSLVTVGERGAEARHRLLETVRRYAAERLAEAGESDAVRRRHADHFLAFAEAAEPELIGPRQSEWMDRLEADHENLRSALRWLLDSGAVVPAARLAGMVWRFWQTRGYLGEGRRWLEEALAAMPDAEAGPDAREWRATRAKALQGAGVLAWGQGDYDRSVERFEAGLALFQELGDSAGVASLYNNLGVIALHRGDYPRAAVLFEASLARRREQGQSWGIATALNNLGATAGKRGDPERARAYYEESLALQRTVGNTHGIALVLGNLGDVAYGEGDHARARALFDESLALRRRLGDKTGIAASLGKLAAVAMRQRDHACARALYEESLALLGALGDKDRIAWCLLGVADLAVEAGRTAGAVRLLGAADAIREAIGAPPTPEEARERDLCVARARARMDGPSFEAAWTVGRALPTERAVELAAEELRASADRAADAPPVSALSATLPPVTAGATRGPGLRILAFGPLEVWRGGEAVTAAEWGSAKPRELLFYLLSHPGGRTKEQVGLALWPEASRAQLRNSFHVTLHHLRRALGGPGWIVFQGNRYRFDRSLPHEYDVDAFKAHLERAEGHRRAVPPASTEAIDALEAAMRLYRGDFVEGAPFGEWHRQRQDELRRAHLDALGALAELLAGERRWAEAVDVYRRLLARDDLMERAHRGLMRCLARQGEREQALRHYPVLLALLREELDAAPEPETVALYERLRRGVEV